MLSGKAGKLHVLGQRHFSLMVPMPQSSSVCLCRWKVDGRDINTDSDLNYSLVEGNLLISNPHVINHGGVYQCIATNTFGTVVSREAKVQFACELILIFFKICIYCHSSEKKIPLSHPTLTQCDITCDSTECKTVRVGLRPMSNSIYLY